MHCRAEAAEREGVLRTKAMREKEEMRTALRHYRFVLLRVRLPDGVILQGKFSFGCTAPKRKFGFFNVLVCAVPKCGNVLCLVIMQEIWPLFTHCISMVYLFCIYAYLSVILWPGYCVQ